MRWVLVVFLVAACRLCVAADGDLSAVPLIVFPDDGTSGAAVISEEAGQWLVETRDFEQLPARSVLTEDGGSIVLFSGRPGTLVGVLFLPLDRSKPMRRVRVTLGGSPSPPIPDPPGPDPPVPPGPTPPGPRWVVMIYEASDVNPAFAAVRTSEQLLTYLAEKGHKWSFRDKDSIEHNGQGVKWVQQFREIASRAGHDGLPVLFIVDLGSGVGGKKMLFVGDVPESDAALIELVKAHGG